MNREQSASRGLLGWELWTRYPHRQGERWW